MGTTHPVFPEESTDQDRATGADLGPSLRYNNYMIWNPEKKQGRKKKIVSCGLLQIRPLYPQSPL